MSIENSLRKPSYIGKAMYLDFSTKEIIASGYGQFDAEAMSMSVSLTSTAAGEYKQIMVILETAEGYIAPFVIYHRTLLLNMPVDTTYTVEAYLRWPAYTDILTITQMFSSISLIIEAQHAPEKVSSTLGGAGVTTRLLSNATAAKLDTATYKDITVTVSAGYAIQRNSGRTRTQTRPKMNTYMKYHFTRTNLNGFKIGNIGQILLAFKLHWINYFDSVDCVLASVKLGDHITLVLAENQLLARFTGAREYKSAPTIKTPFYTNDLAKVVHFFINPQRKKTLSASSKSGLAFIRIIDHRFRVNTKVLDMDIASLIFALQSLSESLAEGETKKRNRATAKETKWAIHNILGLIRSIQDTLPEEVASFYLRQENEIYKLITRPTFMQSLNIALEKLNIDIAEHQQMLRAIDKARRQVVHSEGYSAEFLLNLLANSIVRIKVGNDGLARSIVVTHGVSDIDKLYRLLRLMVRRYFEHYDP